MTKRCRQAANISYGRNHHCPADAWQQTRSGRVKDAHRWRKERARAPNRGLASSLVGIYLERQLRCFRENTRRTASISGPKSTSRSHGLRGETRREPGSRRGLLPSNQPLPSHWGRAGGRRYTSAGFKSGFYLCLGAASFASHEYTSDKRLQDEE